jgi:hypothetical protein
MKIFGLKFFGSKESEILEYENTMIELSKYVQNVSIEQKCKTINMVNRMLMDKENYTLLYTECVQKSSKVYNKIIGRMNSEK